MRHKDNDQRRRPNRAFRMFCAAMCLLGAALMLGAAGSSDLGAPLLPCMVRSVIGLAMVGCFGWLGGLMS